MNRRSALKQAALLAGGIALLPSCNFGPQRVAVALHNLQIDPDHQDLLATLVETIIPSDETPGSTTLNLHHFVLVMVDDCEPKEEQDKFISGLQSLQSFTKEHLGKSFPKKDQKKNEEILTELLALDEAQEVAMPGLTNIKSLVSTTKRYGIQGYMNSKYFLTEKFAYQLVPGPFQACVSTEGLTVM